MIKLYKDKIVLSGREGDTYVNNLFQYLHEPVEIHEGFTVGDFFGILEKDKEIYDIIFSSHLGGHDLDLYTEDCFRDSVNNEINCDDVKEEVLYCSLIWKAELNENNLMDIYIDFAGIGHTIKNGIKKVENFALDFTPLHELKAKELKLDESFSLFKSNSGNSELICEGTKWFTVYDVIGTILYEASFSGDPIRRDAIQDQLISRADDLGNED